MNAPWWEDTLVGFDLETTGVDPREDRIVTASIVIDTPGADVVLMDWLVNPGVDIPEGATAVHGVTTEQAQAEGQDAAEAVAQIVAKLAGFHVDDPACIPVPVVVFNASYDLTMLAAEAARHSIGHTTPFPVVDPLVCDKAQDRYRKGKRTLGAMCEHYGVRLDDAHTSHADALAAIGVARAIGRTHGYPPRLHQRQVEWKAEQAAGLQEYFRRTKDPTAVVEPGWPVLPLTQGVPA
ncbi:3'-5' exonuclease [Occultella kanbiaonis]|uniref:3'-5' exonuclease n=1 Tax=Occultella kanbiaonis TaxID=2675754 RepID=UPI0013CF7754|nr:3'-5' exonuclease [Occultella kanbiaonis]